MRLLYQSLGVTRRSTSGDYAQRLSAILAGAAAPGTQIELQGLSPGRAIADQYRYLEYLDTAEILENGLAAERNGYDAFLLGNIFEPGMHALRELLNIPVLGLCEASVMLACLMGASFSVVNVNPKFARRVSENIASYGLASRLVSIDQMTVERPAMFDRAFEDEAVRDDVIEQFRTAARQGLAKGAETVIPAGGIVMTLLAEAGVHEVDNAPVVNGMIALVKIGELAASLRQLTGHFTSKRLTYAPPAGALLADIRRVYGNHIYPGAA
ncbi:MAG TPA: aspartate/glutamate racemase family protein [Stellaceae bacterium]|jgi:allantoin racemase|nr:aspartate/glutamate racemase family protein [Stellaceae bacterium]